jgi:hypothetical protein
MPIGPPLAKGQARWSQPSKAAFLRRALVGARDAEVVLAYIVLDGVSQSLAQCRRCNPPRGGNREERGEHGSRRERSSRCRPAPGRRLGSFPVQAVSRAAIRRVICRSPKKPGREALTAGGSVGSTFRERGARGRARHLFETGPQESLFLPGCWRGVFEGFRHDDPPAPPVSTSLH